METNYILFTFRPNKLGINGFFEGDDGYVYINKDLDKISRELVYAHESQHRACFLNKCKCWKPKSDFLCEYHAFRAEFNFVLKKNTPKNWKHYFNFTIKDLIKFSKNGKNIKNWKEHFQALAKVCRLKDFQRFAKKYRYKKRIDKILEKGI